MDDLYKTPTKNGGRTLDSDEVTLFQTPNKGLVDRHRHNWRETTSPSRGLPHSNRDNVVDALKNIQDRIRALEVERTTAEENLKDLSKETNFYRQSLERIRQQSPRTPKSVSPRAADAGYDHTTLSGHSPRRPSSRHQHDVEEQLRSADSRCELLDKQLEYMRKMLNEAEAEKRLAYERSEQMIRLRNANNGQEMRSQMDKISDMEREHHRLQASQAVAQERIRQLERKLEESQNEQMTRPVPNNLSSELRSAAKTNKILIENLSPPVSPDRRKTEAPVKQKRRKRTKKAVQAHPKPTQHYRLNLADIPFVVGQSTAPSHRVGSNVQNVIAMMKGHNPELCAAAGTAHPRPRSAPPRVKRGGGNKQKLIVSETATDHSEDEHDIQDMMDQLTEEYTHMSAEHHELTREMDAATSRTVAADVHHEIEKLEIRMSTKAEQIAKLSAYQSKLRDRSRRPESAGRSTTTRSIQARNAARHVPSSSTTGEVQVTTTIKTRGRRSDGITEHRPPSRTETLQTLKQMKTLKTRLKPDDLHWST